MVGKRAWKERDQGETGWRGWGEDEIPLKIRREEKRDPEILPPQCREYLRFTRELLGVGGMGDVERQVLIGALNQVEKVG